MSQKSTTFAPAFEKKACKSGEVVILAMLLWPTLFNPHLPVQWYLVDEQMVHDFMYLTSEKKAELFAKYGKDAKNTGSAESQIALFTFRINHLTEHLKNNRKDFGTERALTALVGKRRRMLDYLKAKDIERYRAIIKELGIRK